MPNETGMKRFFGTPTRRVEPQREDPTTEPTTPVAQPKVDAGKAGTISTDEYSSLTTMIDKYGPEMVINKIGKICKKRADGLKREYAKSKLAKTYDEIATLIESQF